MRGQKSQMKGMKAGQTIVAERERAESDSERMQARKKQHRKQATAIIVVILMAGVLGLAAYLGMKELSADYRGGNGGGVEEYEIKAQIVDEDGHGQISGRTRSYIANLEKELAASGYQLEKVTLPTGKSRELYVDIDGRTDFLKVSMDRGVAVTVEDAKRMWGYLKEHELSPTYVDVRVEGKAYYL